MQQDPSSRSASLLREEIKLQINQNLFQGGYITREMYDKANIMIVKNPVWPE